MGCETSAEGMFVSQEPSYHSASAVFEEHLIVKHNVLPVKDSAYLSAKVLNLTAQMNLSMGSLNDSLARQLSHPLLCFDTVYMFVNSQSLCLDF